MSIDQDARRKLYEHLLAPDAERKIEIQKAALNAGKGIKTGIILNHRNVRGEVSDYELTIPKYKVTLLVARTGGGKTTYLVNIIRRMAMQKANGFLITLEEPEHDLRAKLLACYSRELNINYQYNAITVDRAVQLLAGFVPTEQEITEVTAFEKDIIARCRIIDANQAFDIDKVAQPTIMYDPQFIADIIKFRNVGKKHPLDYVVVDFGQLMESEDTDNANSYQRMKAVMQACKNMAGGLGIAVIAGAQMHRQVAKLPIWEWEPEHIRDGSDMEQAASLILATGRDKEYHDEEYQMAARIMKNRGGPTTVAGMFKIDWENCYVPDRGLEPSDS